MENLTVCAHSYCNVFLWHYSSITERERERENVNTKESYFIAQLVLRRQTIK